MPPEMVFRVVMLVLGVVVVLASVVMRAFFTGGRFLIPSIGAGGVALALAGVGVIPVG